MTVAAHACGGCGRSTAVRDVVCPSCDRPLARGGEVPPGWTMVAAPPPRSASAPGGEVDPFCTAPAGRVGAGVDGGAGTGPVSSADLPPVGPGGGPGWGLRPTLALGSGNPNIARTRRELSTPAAAPRRKRASRTLAWALVGVILLISATALFLVMARVAWHR